MYSETHTVHFYLKTIHNNFFSSANHIQWKPNFNKNVTREFRNCQKINSHKLIDSWKMCSNLMEMCSKCVSSTVKWKSAEKIADCVLHFRHLFGSGCVLCERKKPSSLSACELFFLRFSRWLRLNWLPLDFYRRKFKENHENESGNEFRVKIENIRRQPPWWCVHGVAVTAQGF